MNKISVLGANPAFQKTLFFPEFRYGEVNRAVEMQIFPAGKGINFCRAANLWGKTVNELIQFTGGSNGDFVREKLAEEQMLCINIPTAGNTRCCTTCLDQKNQIMTEVIEPSTAATIQEVNSMLEAFEKSCISSAGAAICGSLPDGTDYKLYESAAEIAHKNGAILLFDAWKSLDKCLNEGRNILKINKEELFKLTSLNDVKSALRMLFGKFKLEFAAITDGADAAFASDGENFFTYSVPRVDKVINPIGCGDTASAVWLSEIISGTEYSEAFRYALGSASANCLTALPGNFVPERASALAAEVSIRRSPLV